MRQKGRKSRTIRAVLTAFTVGCFGPTHTALCGQDESDRASLATPTALPFEKVLPGPITDYEVMHADSGWGTEYILSTSHLTRHGFFIDCKQGRSCANVKPWLMVRNRKTQRGLAVSVAYPGNWRIEVRPAGDNNTLLRAATVPDKLPTFETVDGLPVPGALVAEFIGHWDTGAQPITRFIRARLLRDLDKDWPWVQYNTWYDRYQELDEAHLLETVRAAAKLGCELFVVDAGWYGRHSDWSAALGDWRVNTDRLPNGIQPIADEVRKHGMKFGMWVEIECAHPGLPVGKEHPDWYLRRGDRLVSDRGVLNFGHPDALAWAKAEVDRIVTTYQLDYIKMDFNTDPYDGGDRHPDGHDPLWAHYRGLADLWKHMRSKYPNLVIENCSSGSLRQDVFGAAHTDTHWVSDAVRNNDNLAMNFGMTYAFPPEICNHWTCFPEASGFMDLQTCFTVTMLGQFGLSGAITTWDAETLYHAADRIALYKQFRPLLRNADVFHLTDQVDHKSPATVQAVQYLDPESGRSVLFVFRAGDPRTTTALKLRGLDPETFYRVTIPSGFGEDAVLRGRTLAQGLDISFPHPGSSAVIRMQPVAHD